MNTFGLSYTAAERIKRRFGYNTDSLSFDFPIEIDEKTGEFANFTMSQYNSVMKKNLDDFIYSFKNCVTCLFKNHGDNADNYINMPLILTGGGSRLIGIVDYMKKSLHEQKSIITIVPTSLGARSQSYINCLGAILANGLYRGTLSDNKLNVTKVERNAPQVEANTNKKKINSENHDEL